MNTDRNMHFAVLALQAGLIDSQRFLEACTAWDGSDAPSLGELLIERGWIGQADRQRIDRLIELKQEERAADASAELTHVTVDLRPPRPAPEELFETRPSSNSPRPDRQRLLPTADDSQSMPGGYTLTSLHATGGMGMVWLARDKEIGRDVALKELRPEWAEDSTHWARFMQEARITGQLEHPGVVPVYGLVRRSDTGQPFYTMRFIKGRTLSEEIATYHQKRREGSAEPLDLLNLLGAFVTVCNTVAYAHSRGVIHRDLKGQNVVVGDFGEVVVLDWGLAKLIDRPESELPVVPMVDPSAESGGIDLTVQGQTMGTPAYMAPEQAAGRLDLIDARTDVYGLGAILYEILTGQPPFTGTSTLEVIQKARDAEPIPPRRVNADAPPALEAVCVKALAKAPADRYASATLLGREVQIWQDVQRRRAEDDLRQAFERLMRQQSALVELTHSEAFGGPDLTAVFQQLIEVAARTLEVERVSVWRYTGDRRAIRCAALFERSLGRHSAGAELTADSYPAYFKALAVSEVIAADDAQQDPRTREFAPGYLAPLGIGAMMDVPIPPDAMICHEHVGPPRPWLPDEQLFGIAVAHLAAHAISQWERRQALDELSRSRNLNDAAGNVVR